MDPCLHCLKRWNVMTRFQTFVVPQHRGIRFRFRYRNLWGQVSKAPAPQLNTAACQWLKRRRGKHDANKTDPFLSNQWIRQNWTALLYVWRLTNLHICYILLSEAKFEAGVINGLYRELKARSGNRPELPSAHIMRFIKTWPWRNMMKHVCSCPWQGGHVSQLDPVTPLSVGAAVIA